MSSSKETPHKKAFKTMPGTTRPENLRRFIRADMRGRAVLFFGKDSEVSETIQVSEGGLMTYTTQRLVKGDLLTVHFSVVGKFLRARAEVLYVLPADLDGRYRVGFRFQSLFDEYRTAIRELIS